MRPRTILAAMLWVVAAAGCGGPHDGRTGDVATDACLHWTACVTPPSGATGINLAGCVMASTLGRGLYMPWPTQAVTITASQAECMAAADLDCEQALDCVSTAAPAPCASPTWSCDGDTLTRCDTFSGARIVTEDCAAEGLHCVPVGEEARCAVAACDATSPVSGCDGNRVVDCQAVEVADRVIGGIQLVEEDCSAHDATCTGSICIGNGPACTLVPPNGPESCDGDLLVSCDDSGHQERTDCAASGLHCVSLGPNTAGFEFGCGAKSGLVTCIEGNSFGVCVGSSISYCDDHGNAKLDCKELGYSDCADGHCVP